VSLVVLGVAAGLVIEARPAPEHATPPPQTQQPQQPPTFRAGVRTVPVWATVNDGKGGLILDLTRDHFEVRDNGKVQEITQFTSTQLPLTTVVMIDGSGSMLPAFDAVLDAASAFVIRMFPEDKIRIGSFADLMRMGKDFSSDRDYWLEFLHNQFNIRMGNTTRLWDAIREAVLLLSEAEGRRAVLVFTDGWDVSSAATPARILADARQRDVILYAVAMWTGRGTEKQRPSRELGLLATDTGGGFYELSESDEMNSTFTQISMELHHQYVLGFAPAVQDGKVHKIDVKVVKPGLPNVKVRARKSYVADATKR
jgi:VWFA-related protein